MYPMNYYYGPYFRRPVQRLDQGGIPAIRSVAVTTDTTNSEVIYNISPCQFRSLPRTGIMLLNIVHSPASGSDSYAVSIATTATNSTTTTTSKTPLINGSGNQMISSEITQGNRYLIFYDKCTGVFQTINHIVPLTAATASESE